LSGKCGWLRREGSAHPPSREFGTWLAQEGEGRGCFLVTTYERPEQKDLPVALIARGKAHGRCPYQEYLFRCPLPPSSAKRGSKRAIVAIGQDPCLDPLSAPTQLPVSRTRSRLLSEASCPQPLPIHCPSLATPWLPGHAHTCSAGNLSIFERAFWLVRHHQVYSGVGADIVRESISLIDRARWQRPEVHPSPS
jgi:hypothetical protein